ncbi:MAG: hypothetical protein KJ550_09510 [Proteobacteria bacterium]|nr:hypothetical protein [Desulfobacteraceae bacterium]MBU3980662.1 hypothetical protein [Pseudomonadota bacterium]MBU4013691.1 hypothetical protein [Pseudomonadota bacterium]MBU4067746.1 hypothetical protein [Pseudomonadota bacterium]MBU4100258.1 hypothetical protein [Pseudomonadota bacterium]
MRKSIAYVLCLSVVFMFLVSMSEAGDKVYLKKGELEKYNSLPSGKELYVMKKNGSYDDRANDLEELCKDYLYYRNKILKYAKAGDNQGAAKARSSFNQVNSTMSLEYTEKDIQQMFTLIEKSGYKAP